MSPALPFAYRPPAEPVSGGGLWRLRWVRALPALALLALPFVPLQQGSPGSLAAGVTLPNMRSLTGGEIQPPATPGELTPAPFAVEPASPFIASYGDAASALRAETCLTEAIYYEGAMESESGQRAIAQVVLNRVRHPAYPDNVCGVVFQGQERSTGCQFTFTCDGSRARPPMASLWQRANKIAKAALGGAVAAEVGMSTHYHADYVMPYWSSSLDPSGQIGRHVFYRWRGNNGKPEAFTMRYSGREPLIAAYTPRAATGNTGDAILAPTDGALPQLGQGVAAEQVMAVPPAPAPFRARPLLLASQSGNGVK